MQAPPIPFSVHRGPASRSGFRGSLVCCDAPLDTCLRNIRKASLQILPWFPSHLARGPHLLLGSAPLNLSVGCAPVLDPISAWLWGDFCNPQKSTWTLDPPSLTLKPFLTPKPVVPHLETQPSQDPDPCPPTHLDLPPSPWTPTPWTAPPAAEHTLSLKTHNRWTTWVPPAGSPRCTRRPEPARSVTRARARAAAPRRHQRAPR